MLVTLQLSDNVKDLAKSSISAVSGFMIRMIVTTVRKCLSNIKSTVNKKVRKALVVLQEKDPEAMFTISLPLLSENDFAILVQTSISEWEMELQYVLTKKNMYRPNGFTKIPKTLKTYKTQMKVARVIAIYDSIIKSYSNTSQMDRILKDIKFIKKTYHDTNDNVVKTELERVGKGLFNIVKFIIRYRNLQTETLQGIVNEFNRVTKVKK